MKSKRRNPSVSPMLFHMLTIAVLGTIYSGAAQDVTVDRLGDSVGPHYRIWSRPENNQNTSTESRLLRNHGNSNKIVEVATGLNYWDGKAWSPSDPTFIETPQGFFANKVQHKVRLASNLNTISAVTLTTPEGIELNSTPVAIGLFDEVSGEFAVIGTIANCEGAMLSTNQIIYQNAFNGICADIVYTLDKNSFEQDIIFTGQLDPAAYGFFPKTTRIQILTEFYAPPQPERTRQPLYVEHDSKIRQNKSSPDLMDETLTFGEHLFIGLGQAFTSDESESTANKVLVAKEFKTFENRHFLIESLPYGSIAEGLRSLPECQLQTQPEQASHRLHLPSAYASLPKPLLQSEIKSDNSRKKTLQLANTNLRQRRGVVIDYRATLSGGNMIAQSDTTYLVSGTLTCNSLTIEGGAVLKYKPNALINFSGCGTILTCKASQYRPAYFTAVDDDSVGESMLGYANSGYTGIIASTGYASPALDLLEGSGFTLSNCRIRYAKVAIRYFKQSANPTSGSVIFNHSQLYRCIVGLSLTSCGCGCSGSLTARFNDTLMSQVQSPISAGSGFNLTKDIAFVGCTLDQSSSIFIGPTINGTVKCTNSVFANITNASSLTPSGTYNGFYKAGHFGTFQFGSDTVNPFQAIGTGIYYLSSASGYRDVGITTGVSASYLADLKLRTTYPPTLLSTVFSTDTTLNQTAFRDVDTPDLGYHYDPLDYIWSTLSVSSGKTLTLGTGVSIGIYGSSGLTLNANSKLISQGAPNQMNHLVRYNVVQEQALLWGTTAGQSIDVLTPLSSSLTQLRFTDVSLVDGDAGRLWNLTSPSTATVSVNDSTIRGAYLHVDDASSTMLLTFNNNVFVRCNLRFQSPVFLNLRNNLFLGGQVGLICQAANSTWVTKDCIFDTVTMTQGSQTFSNAYNAYTSTNTLNGAFKSRTLAVCDYRTGPLGEYYCPMPPGAQLASLSDFDTGTRADQVGLYHYTTHTNLSSGRQIKEGYTSLDVGFHYVAVDSNGNPIDSNGDGVADFIADADGNGMPDAWEISYFGHTGIDPMADTDVDGLANYQECLLGLNPANPDTGATGVLDGKKDADGDGLSNEFEFKYTNTDPLVFDSTHPGSGIGDYDRIYSGRQGANGTPPAGADPNDLWFETISNDGITFVIILHNTVSGTPYLLFSTQDFSTWIVEREFIGDAGRNYTQLSIKEWSRSFITVIAATGNDLNSNGIPDAWERKIARTTLGTLDPNGNLDGDDALNIDEYIQGRNPLSAGFLPDTTGTFISLQVY
jgi:hypothetical protein